jgi:Ca-activated chloride channel family protein
MSRARQSVALLVLGIVGHSGTAWPTGTPEAKPAVPPPFSPTKVLAQLSGQTGPVGGPPANGRGGPDAATRSLAPYLMVVGEGHDGTEQVPLKETTAEVSIAGVIARVQVHQVFENGGRTPIEAVYVFPASTRAAVHGVRMRIGARTIEARIDRRAAARESYETARREGRRASLLEQERANVFTMSVANIMPGDRIAVEMDYSEMLVPEDAVYELVYPTVVGPRYAGGADPVKDKWIANPHLPAGTPEPYRFDIKVHLETGIPIKDLASPSHGIAVNYSSSTRAHVALAAPGGGNRDFVLRYRLAGNKIESGLLLWEGEGGGGRRESFFALMLEPPQRPTAAQIPGREFIFLLDVSGSMHGYPLDTAKALMRSLLGRLRPSDTFNVALFSGSAHVVSPSGSLPAVPDQIARAVAEIEREHGGGGTELMGGLEMSYRIPRREPGRARTVVVVTDGFVGVEAQAFRFIRERLDEANLFAFGIGHSVNRGLIEGMARAGQGEPFVVTSPAAAAGEAEKLRAYIEQPVLAHVGVSFSGFDAYEVAPQKLPDLMARRPVVLFGKYRGSATGRIQVSGTSGGGRWSQAVEVRAADVRAENAALRWLWARRWVDLFEDERAMGAGPGAEEGITSLGLDYKLLTTFTSFVAVDSEVVNPGGAGHSVRQPLPMPEGVSNLAVAEAAAAAPSPPPMGSGLGMMGIAGTGGLRRKAPAKAAIGSAALSDDLVAADKESSRGAGNAERAKKEEPARARPWRVTVEKPTLVGPTEPLANSLRALLTSGRAGCLAAVGALTARLTIDATGRVVRVDITGGDRTGEACLRRLLVGLTSATVARGRAQGSVEIRLLR